MSRGLFPAPAASGRRPTRLPADPAEPWEIDSSELEPEAPGRGIYDVFPHAPRRTEDLPPGSLEALDGRCALRGLQQVFVIPRAVRSTGYGAARVTSPRCVLGVGTRAVGLWTEEPTAGLKGVVPLDEIGAIEDVTILLYGRLSFLSFSQKLTIRYNTLARSFLRPVLLALRERIAAAPLPLPQSEPSPAELPLKWKRLLRGPLARLREDAPVVFRFAVAAAGAGEDVHRGQLLVLNPHELVYMQDPPEASHNYGEDTVVVPRGRITRARVRDKRLEIASCGARLSLQMSPDLLEAAARWLAAE